MDEKGETNGMNETIFATSIALDRRHYKAMSTPTRRRFHCLLARGDCDRMSKVVV